MGALGTTELLIVLAILVVVFGARRLPGLARSIGEARRELTRGLDDDRPDPDVE